ncbi:MAG: efflux RND transporter periplasmic adaptor subunit [Burkholderiales bacterium]|nr:MAG: efflux RND transporter periplasmic adaptor subunit [Burkholderiales bacterium]
MAHFTPTASLRPARRALCLTMLASALAGPMAVAQPVGSTPASATNTRTVQAARLDTSQVFPVRDAPARVRARNVSRLSAEVNGTLQQWTADVGATVRRGQLLARVDPRDQELGLQRARAALEASQARLALAQAQLQRARELTAQGFLSPEALAQRETEVALVRTETDANRAQLATAQRQLDKTVLRAPFDAEVVERLAQTGEAVAPGSLLYVLAETGAVELDATVNPLDAASLPRARRLRFEANGQAMPVRLLRIGSTMSEPARTRTARLAFEAGSEAASPGTAGRLVWEDARPHLPPQWLARRNGVIGVFVIDGDTPTSTVRFRPLPGAQEGRVVPVPSDWPGSTLMVVGGQAALQDGQTVTVTRASN